MFTSYHDLTYINRNVLSACGAFMYTVDPHYNEFDHIEGTVYTLIEVSSTKAACILKKDWAIVNIIIVSLVAKLHFSMSSKCGRCIHFSSVCILSVHILHDFLLYYQLVVSRLLGRLKLHAAAMSNVIICTMNCIQISYAHCSVVITCTYGTCIHCRKLVYMLEDVAMQ